MLPSKRARIDPNGLKIPVLDREQYLARLQKVKSTMNPIAAMYSSIVDGIVTDAELMTIPIDDHMIVRGHAVFDTCCAISGVIYRLDPHLDRFLASAKDARLPLPFEGDEKSNRKRMADVIAHTVIASRLKDCQVRYYLSAGPGNFGVTPAGCKPGFYVVVHADASGTAWDGQDHSVKAATVTEETVPLKPPLLARVKTNNYMLNVLQCMAAEDKGASVAIACREDGVITESSVANVAFITKDQRFVTPKFDQILRGTTIRKVMGFAEQLVSEGVLKAVLQEDLKVEDVKKNVVEAFLTGGDTHVKPITHWDGEVIGTGHVGEITKKLLEKLGKEAETGTGDHYELSSGGAAN